MGAVLKGAGLGEEQFASLFSPGGALAAPTGGKEHHKFSLSRPAFKRSLDALFQRWPGAVEKYLKKSESGEST